MRIVFFFKQKTAYGMRISDWSSDVCSSDLHVHEIIKTHSLCCWPQAPAATSVALAIAPIWRNGQPALRRLKPPLPDPATMVDAGWSSPVARQAHNLKVAGSNPAPATNAIKLKTPPLPPALSFTAKPTKTLTNRNRPPKRTTHPTRKST